MTCDEQQTATAEVAMDTTNECTGNIIVSDNSTTLTRISSQAITGRTDKLSCCISFVLVSSKKSCRCANAI